MPRAAGPVPEGFSLIEAMVALGITALVASLLLPTMSRGVRNDFALANRSLDAVARSRSEAQFRTLLRSIVQPDTAPGEAPPVTTVAGTPAGLAFAVEAGARPGCARAGTYAVVTLRIAPVGGGGRLLCDAGSGETEMFAWESGIGRFAYSADGNAWLSQWPDSLLRFGAGEAGDQVPLVVAPLVRLTVADRGRSSLVWIEAAGATAPLDVMAEDHDAAPAAMRAASRAEER